MRYLVELSDDNSNSARLDIRLPLYLPLTSRKNSPWRLVMGSLKVMGGACEVSREISFTPFDVSLIHRESDGIWYWGIRLFEMFDALELANDSGTGYLSGSWAKPGGLTKGTITWVMI